MRVTFDPGLLGGRPGLIDLEALDDALTRLAAQDPELARVVEVRFFGGLSIEETAEAWGFRQRPSSAVGPLAKAWLARDLGREEARES